LDTTEVVGAGVVAGLEVGAGALVGRGVDKVADEGLLVVPPAVLVPVLLPVPVLLAVLLEPLEDAGLFPTQLESGPSLILKGADEAVVPVLSRTVRPICVPAAIFTSHVRDVPSWLPKFWRAGAPGWLPGRTLTK